MRNKQFKGEHVTAYPCLPKHLWKKTNIHMHAKLYGELGMAEHST